MLQVLINLSWDVSGRILGTCIVVGFLVSTFFFFKKKKKVVTNLHDHKRK